MTHLYTDTSNVDSPMWLFHLPTFTLAQLHLNGGPSGNHLLTFVADGFPPAEALASFSATLEAMAPSASDHLTTVSRANAAQVLPEFLRFIPEKNIPGQIFLTLAPRHGYAHVRTITETHPYWQGGSGEKTAEAKSIQQAAIASDEEFLRQLPPPSF